MLSYSLKLSRNQSIVIENFFSLLFLTSETITFSFRLLIDQIFRKRNYNFYISAYSSKTASHFLIVKRIQESRKENENEEKAVQKLSLEAWQEQNML